MIAEPWNWLKEKTGNNEKWWNDSLNSAILFKWNCMSQVQNKVWVLTKKTKLAIDKIKNENINNVFKYITFFCINI